MSRKVWIHLRVRKSDPGTCASYYKRIEDGEKTLEEFQAKTNLYTWQETTYGAMGLWTWDDDSWQCFPQIV